MSIRKPMALGLIVGVLALAFAALPAFASAATTLDNEAGTALAVGAPVTGTSSNLVFKSATGVELKCGLNTLSGSVAANAPAEPKVSITSATFKAAGGGVACLTSVAGLTAEVNPDPNPPKWTLAFGKEDKFSLSSASGAIAFTAKFNTGTECTFKRTTVTGTYNTNVAPATLTVGAGQTFERVTGPVAECGATGTLTGSFSLKTGAVGVKVTP